MGTVNVRSRLRAKSGCDLPYVMLVTIEIEIKSVSEKRHTDNTKTTVKPLYSNTNQLQADRLGFVQIGLWPE